MFPPGRIAVDAPAFQTSTPRALSGKWRQIDFTAGGLVSVRYERIFIGRRAQVLHWNRIARQLDGGMSIIVPIETSLTIPGPAPATGITHSDGTLFSDAAGYAQYGVSAALVGDHILNAGTVTFSLIGDAELSGGEWFSIRHAAKNWRAYGIWAIDDIDEGGADPVYTVAIQPPLREAAPAGTALDFSNPRFLGQLAEGASMPTNLAGNWHGEASVSFVERFEV